MKITNNGNEVLYKNLKHNEHFKCGHQEYVKIDSRINDYEIIRCALKVSDGYLAEFSPDQWVKKISKDNTITLNNVEFGQVFRYENKYYLRFVNLTSDVMIIELQTGDFISLNKETLVELVDAELIVNDR